MKNKGLSQRMQRNPPETLPNIPWLAATQLPGQREQCLSQAETKQMDSLCPVSKFDQSVDDMKALKRSRNLSEVDPHLSSFELDRLQKPTRKTTQSDLDKVRRQGISSENFKNQDEPFKQD